MARRKGWISPPILIQEDGWQRKAKENDFIIEDSKIRVVDQDGHDSNLPLAAGHIVLDRRGDIDGAEPPPFQADPERAASAILSIERRLDHGEPIAERDLKALPTELLEQFEQEGDDALIAIYRGKDFGLQNEPVTTWQDWVLDHQDRVINKAEHGLSELPGPTREEEARFHTQVEKDFYDRPTEQWFHSGENVPNFIADLDNDNEL